VLSPSSVLNCVWDIKNTATPKVQAAYFT
jgi:hypothetical protein